MHDEDLDAPILLLALGLVAVEEPQDVAAAEGLAAPAVEVLAPGDAASLPIDMVGWSLKKALGLGKLNSVRELKDSPQVRGLINQLHYLVKVED